MWINRGRSSDSNRAGGLKLRRFLLSTVVFILLILALIAGIILGYSFVQTSTVTVTANQSQTPPVSTTTVLLVQYASSVVDVSGKITTNNIASEAVGIVFSNQKTSLGSSVSNGTYSISLFTGTYNVTVETVGKIPFGEDAYYQYEPAAVGEISVNSSVTSSLSEDWNVSTPNAQVNVSGIVYLQKSHGTPSTISFYLPATHAEYTAKLVQGHYSISLPNLENYVISIGIGNPSSSSCEPRPNTLAIMVFEGKPASISSDWVC